MAASSSTKIVFNVSCFSTSLLLALLPLLPFLASFHHPFHISAPIVLTESVTLARKPKHRNLVSTSALSAAVQRMLEYQLYFIIALMLYVAYLLLLVQSSRRPPYDCLFNNYDCLSLLNLVCFAPYFAFHCSCWKYQMNVFFQII